MRCLLIRTPPMPPTRPRSLCFVAGEPSGDLHGAHLVAEIKRRHPDWTLWGVGSDRMAAAGCDLWQNAREWAVMGFVEVLRSLPAFRRRLRGLTQEIERRRPDHVILIDFPGFNLKLAPRVHRLGIPVTYYIVPQIWAWGKGRLAVFRRHIAHTIVVFPFEIEFFEGNGIPVEWVGHPLVDIVRPSAEPTALKRRFGVPDGHRLVAMMPGARVQDFEAHLPLFSEAVRRIAEAVPNVHAGIGVSGALAERTQRLTEGPVPLVMTPDAYDLMAAADVVLTKTGTTTVECALLDTPMVAAYRTGALNYAIARALVDVPFIAMPNLIANRRVIPEFVQKGATPEALAREAIMLLTERDAAQKQRKDLTDVRSRLGPPGAVGRVADLIESWMDTQS